MHLLLPEPHRDEIKGFFLCEKQAELINLFLFISPSMFSSPAAHHTT